MTPPIVPDRGHVVWIDFDPQAGSEQAGRRPGLILSPAAYNGRTGLALVCPITNRAKGYKFEVAVPPGLPLTGVVLSDHVKNLDWRARNAVYHCDIPAAVVDDVLQKLAALLI